MRHGYKFSFGPGVPFDDAWMSLDLATYAAEGLYGEASIRMDLEYAVVDPTITVWADSVVGMAVARIFTELLIREFGEDAIKVRRAT